MTGLFLAALLAASAQTPVLYKAGRPVAPSTERFTAPTLVEPATLNPPGFRWSAAADPDARYDLEIARTPGFTGDGVRRYSGLTVNVFCPERPFDPGHWYWRVRAGRGRWSEAREFELASGLPELAVPPVAQLLGRLRKQGHPRLFLTPRTLPEWRAAIRGTRAAEWKTFTANLDRAARIDASDPPRLTAARNLSAENNRIFRSAVTRAENVGQAIQSLGLSCLLAGNQEHCAASRRLLLELASWDPREATSCKVNDEACRATVRGLARGYDWLAGAGILTPEDHTRIGRVIAFRGAQLVEWMGAAGVSTRWPSSSHANGGVPPIGELATAFAGVVPEAGQWLNYFVHVATCNYPGFGRADGSWSEGGRYWHVSIVKHLVALCGLSASLGIDFASHPFFRNSGLYKIYSNPPWDKMTVFGDGHNVPVGPPDGYPVGIAAMLLRNAEYAWYSRATRAKPEAARTASEFLTFDEGLIDRLAAKADLRRLPLAHVFPDTGLTALRTSLTDPAADIEFLIRSNPYGSVSHAHADQGNFYLAAWGEPLLVPSGHYQGSHEVLFGSPHHAGWTWQSWAHNVPLVDGKGQASRSSDAAGQVEHFYHSPVADYVRVDATRAYRAASGGEARAKLEKIEPGLGSRAGAAPVASYRRGVVFFRPGTFVMADHLEAEKDVRLDWLLHSWNRFEIDVPQRSVVASSGEVRAAVRLLTGELVNITQSGDYLVPVPKDFKTQWHLDARFAPARAHRVVSVIHPYRTDETPPVPEMAEGSGWTGARLRWRDGRTGFVGFANSAAPARIPVQGGAALARVVATETSPSKWLYASDVTRLELSGAVWEFSVPVDVLVRNGSITVSATALFEIPNRGRYPAGTTILQMDSPK